jgi:DNA-binding MurR/RpiR family transcriptional regulator
VNARDEGPRPPPTLADRISDALPRFTASERRAARALLARYPTAGMDSIHAFAERAGVSAPTIVRFVAKLGFDGFADFRRALHDESEAQAQFPLTLATTRRDAPDEAAIAGLVRTFVQTVADSFAHVREAELDRFAQLVADARQRVSLVAGNFTDIAARHLEFHLRKMRRDVHLLPDDLWRRADALADFGRRDVLIVFDVRRYQGDVVETARAARARGAAVVLFTDQWMSGAAEVATLVFRARIDAPSPWDTLVGMLALVEAAALRVDRQLAAQTRTRLEAIEALRTQLGITVADEPHRDAASGTSGASSPPRTLTGAARARKPRP